MARTRVRAAAARGAKGVKPSVLRLPARQKLSLVLSYAARLLKPQVLSIGAVVGFLAAFQSFALGIPLRGAAGIGLGSLLCAVGLSAFLEGLFLGIMPLGSQCGMRLPARAPAPAIAAFAFVLGVGATYAEPAVGFLKAVGSLIAPWDSPLLFAMLNRHSGLLTLAIAIGVGAASVLGMLRFLGRLPFKPFVLVILPLALGVSFLAYLDPRLSPVLGLAWDSGAITTGPVTVPLILSLGVGMGKVTGKRGASSAEGFGVVTLAAFLPVLTVVALGALIAPGIPGPMAREEFFRADRREAAAGLFSSPGALDSYAKSNLGAEAFEDYLRENPGASDPGDSARAPASRATVDFLASLQAIVPLCLLLIVVLLFIRERIRQPDELLLGVAFAVFGLFMLNWGMNSGLSEIGRQAGTSLPASYAALQRPEDAVTIRGFDPELLQTAMAEEGGRRHYLLVDGERGPVRVPYDPAAHDPERREYRYVPVSGPVFGPGRKGLGISLVLLFAFALGYIVTIAEPSLSALGSMVEDITAGTFRKSALVASTAAGVGLSLALGLVRALWDVPLLFILAPAYALILALTFFSKDDMAALAWDAAGVTTGPVTVPLIIALGLGIGSRTGIRDSFGVLACAGIVPAATVLVSGIRLYGGRIPSRGSAKPGASEAAR